MIKLDIKADLTEAKLSLSLLGVEVGGFGRKLLRALATVVKKRVKRRMGNYLHLGHIVQSSDFSAFKGSLRDAVYGFARSADHAVVASGQMFKAEALEHGAPIRPKKGKFLSFLAEDGWKRVRSVTLPARHWFSQSVEGFENDPDYQGTIDKVLGKAIQKAGLGR